MSQVRLLIHESLRLSLRRRVAACRADNGRVAGRSDRDARVWVAGTELLAFCEREKRLLVSLDRATMPDHVAAHVAAGRSTWGVLFVTRRCSFRQLLDDLVLVWSATEAEEWRNSIHYLPLSG